MWKEYLSKTLLGLRPNNQNQHPITSVWFRCLQLCTCEALLCVISVSAGSCVSQHLLLSCVYLRVNRGPWWSRFPDVEESSSPLEATGGYLHLFNPNRQLWSDPLFYSLHDSLVFFLLLHSFDSLSSFSSHLHVAFTILCHGHYLILTSSSPNTVSSSVHQSIHSETISECLSSCCLFLCLIHACVLSCISVSLLTSLTLDVWIKSAHCTCCCHVLLCMLWHLCTNMYKDSECSSVTDSGSQVKEEVCSGSDPMSDWLALMWSTTL